MNKYPTIKLVLYFIIGLILQKIFSLDERVIYVSFGSLFVLSAFLLLIKRSAGPTLLAFILPIAIISAGMMYGKFRENHTISYPFKKEKIRNAIIYGSVNEISLLGKDRLNFIIEADSVITDEGKYLRPMNIKCGIYESPKNLSVLYSKLRIGNRISLTAGLRRPPDKRNPGAFDYEKYLLEKGISALASSYNFADLMITDPDFTLTAQGVLDIRKGIDAQIGRYLNAGAASLIRGLLLADRSLIDEDTKEQFINAGVVHVLAVSGLHVGFILLIFMLIFGRFNIYLKYIATISGLFAFLIITGSPPSVFRATVMSAVFLIAYLTNRSYNSVNALSIAALIILLFNPDELFNAGFQLSFSAVLSILLLYPVFSSRLTESGNAHPFLKNILLFVLLSVSAQIGTLPFTLAYFGKLSIAAVIANVFVIPLIGLIAGISIFTLFIGVFWASAAHLYGSAVNLFVYILYWLVEKFGTAEISYLIVKQFTLYDAAVFYLFLAAAVFSLVKLRSLKARLVIILLCLANLFVFTSLDNYNLAQPGRLTVIAADIGQGDAFIVMMPDGKSILIDAGEATEYFDNGKNIIMPLMTKLGISRFDYVFISHVDSDHYMGSLSLIKAGTIPLLYKPQPDTSARKDLDYEKLLSANNVSVKYYSREIIKTGNARIYIINDSAGKREDLKDSNDRSGVIKIVYGGTSFLFVGDAGIRAENSLMLRYHDFLKSDVLKVGHHGSISSSGERFIESVRPSFSIISAGIMNKFGHPSEAVLRRLSSAGSQILRTDRSGAIILCSDGEYLRNIDWKKRESSYILE